jgi:hypothetical protein
MIDKSFLEKIEQLSGQQITVFQDRLYSNKNLNMLTPPQAAAFSVSSLSAIIDFCGDEMELGQHVLHVSGCAEVCLYGAINSDFRRRELFVKSTAITGEFQFGRFHKVDEFIIALQAQFVQDETTAAILKLVGNMTRVSEVGTKDDGMTQRVEAKAGLAKVESISVPNPVRLAPYRTFIEVPQPYSNFVLRLNANHECALFEADGGAWRIESMKNVKDFLNNGLKAIWKRDQITILC